MTVELPIIECTSCGKIVGHLYEQYYRHDKILQKYHLNYLNPETVLVQPEEFSTETDKTLWENCYLPYYQYLRTVHAVQPMNFKFALLNEKNLIARALLSDDYKLSFPINDNGAQATRYCCLRTLLCDASYLSIKYKV